MHWRHQYACTTCPRCGADLTQADSVLIEGSGNDGTYLGNFPAALDKTGWLEADAAGILQGGLHSGSSCRACGQILDIYEKIHAGTVDSDESSVDASAAAGRVLHPHSMPVGQLVSLVVELQRLLYADWPDGPTVWNPAKQAGVSPADLQQDLETLLRKYDLLPGSVRSQQIMRATLTRSGAADLVALVSTQHGTLDVRFPGYSDKTSDFGPVIYIELNEQGHPQLYAWTDMANEEPTHVLNFAAAVDERAAQ